MSPEPAHLSQVRQRLLGGADFALPLGQLVGEGDDEAAVAPALVGRQRQDARQVEALQRVLLLREVAQDVRPAGRSGQSGTRSYVKNAFNRDSINI